MKHEESKAKISVLIGYMLLILLLLVGIIGITYQIHKLSKLEKNKGDSENLITVGYVLATLYKAESLGNIIFTPNFDGDYSLLDKKDSLVTIVIDGISYLKIHSDDNYFIQKLDTVELLLSKKNDNELKILQLFDSIMKLPMQKRIVNVVLSQKELDNLTSVIKNRDTRLMDSTRIITKEKSFGEKFGDLFRRQTKDSLIVNNAQTSDTTIDVLPVKFTLDTISQYVTDFLFQRSKKNLQMSATLALRQMELQSINETLFNKINMILRSLEERDTNTKEQLAKKQNDLLLNSNIIGYVVALAAMLIAILFIFNIIRLINRQQNYRQKLELSNEQIEKLLKSREWLILSISHDIKAPMSSILGYTNICMESQNLSENEKYCINNMRNSSIQVIELVNNLINFQKIEQGKSFLKISEISPYKIVNEAFSTFKPIADTKNLKFILNNNFHKNLFCKSDSIFITHILNNLISNALKFTQKGEIEIFAELKQVTNELIFSVRDTGIGIEADDFKKLFDEFERTQSSEIQHIEGSGLGLSISQKLTELLGGKITVVSTKDKGSTFTLSVPVTDVKSVDNENKTTKNKKLLFVDDDLLMLKVCEQMAKKLGYVPYVTDKANNVINILNNNKIDIVFCDINMPEINGFSLVENIRKNFENPPIIFALSATAICEKDLKENGFTDILLKPFSINDLDLSIERFLKNNKSEEKKIKDGNSNFTPLINYAVGDREASVMIMQTFIDENVNIAREIEQAIKLGKSEEIKGLAHKLLPRMKMIENQEIVDILCALERGETGTAKNNNLMKLIENINVQAQEFIDKTLN